jgi:hypothetical protein
MICPMKLANSNKHPVECECERTDCEWWNERFGKCAVAVDAYLKGQEDRWLERDLTRNGER